jgi:ABC-type phosphate transport system ATPase subunit
MQQAGRVVTLLFFYMGELIEVDKTKTILQNRQSNGRLYNRKIRIK